MLITSLKSWNAEIDNVDYDSYLLQVHHCLWDIVALVNSTFLC